MRIHDASPQRAYRIELRRSPIEPPAETIDNPAAIARFCADLATYDRERLVRLDINNRCQLVGVETVAIGAVDTVVVNIADVFPGAILAGATRIAVVHNHPSGQPEPSEADRRIAARLEEAATLLDIPLVDFVIIGDGRYWAKTTGFRRIKNPAPGQQRLTGPIQYYVLDGGDHILQSPDQYETNALSTITRHFVLSFLGTVGHVSLISNRDGHFILGPDDTSSSSSPYSRSLASTPLPVGVGALLAPCLESGPSQLNCYLLKFPYRIVQAGLAIAFRTSLDVG